MAQASVAAPSTSSKNVRRVETVILDEDEEDDAVGHVRMVGAETYDLTYTDNDEDWIMFKDPGEGQGEARFVGYEDLVGGGSRPQKKGCNKVNFVRTVAGGEGTLVILDSGADISALPMRYREVGFPLERVTSLRDAQGGKMTNGGMRQAVVELEDEEGHLVELRESFALSNVKEPLLALGKLLRRGWKIEGENGDARLTHGLFSKNLQFRRNSLVVDAKI